MTEPLVSIIIPTYNRSMLIQQTLNSILEQTYRNWECIVIDDGSTDDTKGVINSYNEGDGRIKYYERPKDQVKGANTCRNYGFEVSKGKYVNWFDDDDIMLSNFIEDKINAFREDTQLVICRGVFVNYSLEIIKEMTLNDNFDIFKEFVLWNQHIITNSVTFRRSFLKAKKLFLPSLSRGQEAEFFSRIFFQLPVETYRIITKPLFFYRQHLGSKSSKNVLYVKSFMSSRSFIALENLRRGFEIKDVDIIKYHYKLLVDFFFRGIENKHNENSQYILNELLKITYKENKLVALELYVLGHWALAINKGRHSIRQRFKAFPVRISC